MLMTRFNPANLFDEFFSDYPFYDNEMKKLEHKLYGHNAPHMMSTDIKENDDCYELEMDLPGFTTDEIKVALENGYLTITAAKGLDSENEDKQEHFIRKERYSGVCSRSFYVGDYVTEDQIKAEFKHGILKLSVPKVNSTPELPQKKYIAIEG